MTKNMIKKNFRYWLFLSWSCYL